MLIIISVIMWSLTILPIEYISEWNADIIVGRVDNKTNMFYNCKLSSKQVSEHLRVPVAQSQSSTFLLIFDHQSVFIATNVSSVVGRFLWVETRPHFGSTNPPAATHFIIFGCLKFKSSPVRIILNVNITERQWRKCGKLWTSWQW